MARLSFLLSYAAFIVWKRHDIWWVGGGHCYCIYKVVSLELAAYFQKRVSGRTIQNGLLYKMMPHPTLSGCDCKAGWKGKQSCSEPFKVQLRDIFYIQFIYSVIWKKNGNKNDIGWSSLVSGTILFDILFTIATQKLNVGEFIIQSIIRSIWWLYICVCLSDRDSRPIPLGCRQRKRCLQVPCTVCMCLQWVLEGFVQVLWGKQVEAE